MAEAESIILPLLREICGRLMRHGEQLRELTARVSGLEQQSAVVITRLAGMDARIDRMDARLERVERRLDLFDPALMEAARGYRAEPGV